jgi:hypothetical protein
VAKSMCGRQVCDLVGCYPTATSDQYLPPTHAVVLAAAAVQHQPALLHLASHLNLDSSVILRDIETLVTITPVSPLGWQPAHSV